MKYFNDYKRYKPINEGKVERDFDIGVLDILRPLFSLIGRGVSRKRLRSIARAYDSYLSIVYKQYISNKKLDIPEEVVDTFNYKDLDDTITVKPIDKNSNKTDILIDDDIEDILNDGKVNDDSTSGVVGSTSGYKPNIKDGDIEKIEDKDSNIDSKDDDDLEEIKLPPIDNKETNELEKSVSVIEDENKKLVQKASKFNRGQKIKSRKINGEKVDVSELGIKYSDDLPTEDKNEIRNIVKSYANNIIKKELLYAISETEKEINREKENYKRYKVEKDKYSNLRKNTAVEVRKKYEVEINRFSEMMEDTQEEIKSATQGLDELKKEFNQLSSKNINESSNWAGTDIYSSTWTEEDKNNLTSLINPYKVREFSMKAEIIIGNSSEKNSKKLKRTWEILKNSVQQRWYYTYDIKSLETGVKAIKNKEESRTPKQKKIIKDTTTISMALKDKYGSDAINYSSPYYLGLRNERYFYRVLNVDNKLFLMEKMLLLKDRYAYKVIGNLSVNKDIEFSIKKMLNTSDEGMTIELKGDELDLYKDVNDFPIIIIKDTKIYSLHLPTKKDTEYIECVALTITSLRDSASNDLLKDVQPSELYSEKLTDEQIKYIKKLDI